MAVTSEMLVGIAGVVLSLFFSYIPGLRVWFAGLASEMKQLIMLGLILVISAVVYILGCNGILVTNIACDKAGLVSFLYIVITAVIANQATYSITPQTNDVLVAKQLRDDGELEGAG